VAEQRVLIIDANLEDRGLITAIFQEQFATPAEHVLHARSGAEAEAILQRTGDFQWLFLDPDLPDMEGLELLERLQPRLTCRSCRQVVVSARRDKAALVTAAGLGVCDYIVKPLDWDRTLGRLRRLVYGHERRSSERVEVIAHYNVAMEFPGCPPYAGRLVDLSMGGAQVKGPAFEHHRPLWPGGVGWRRPCACRGRPPAPGCAPGVSFSAPGARPPRRTGPFPGQIEKGTGRGLARSMTRPGLESPRASPLPAPWRRCGTPSSRVRYPLCGRGYAATPAVAPPWWVASNSRPPP